MNHFCTTTTFSHLYKVYALAESLKKNGSEFTLHVLMVDGKNKFPEFENCIFYKLPAVAPTLAGQIIIEKYSGKNQLDNLRWSLKPVFMAMLMKKPEIEKLIYLDNDILFFSEYQFLFDLLDQHSFLLTPHFYKSDPKKEQNWFESNFRVGLFNAGFVGANKNALSSLHWWAESCSYRCEKNYFRGLFDDQKYLDLIPVMNEDALILHHRGCNVASWNKDTGIRTLINGEVFIAEKFPVVFIHFNPFTIRQIEDGEDNLLLTYYEKYFDVLKKHRSELTREHLYVSESWSDKLKLNIWEVATKLGW